jgi:hypothetical protein
MNQPFSQPVICYEFKIPDITRVEDLPNIVTEKGENIRMVNLWVRKGSYGLVMRAFEVSAGKAEEVLFGAQPVQDASRVKM